MKDICYQYLSGTLAWSGGQRPFLCQIQNGFPFDVVLDTIPNLNTPSVACTDLPHDIGVGQTASMMGGSGSLPAAGYYKVTVAATGALVAVIELSDNVSTVLLDWTVLATPNDIGPIPLPSASVPEMMVEPQPPVTRETSTIIVPPNGAAVLVGFGEASNGAIVLREQYWACQKQLALPRRQRDADDQLLGHLGPAGDLVD